MAQREGVSIGQVVAANGANDLQELIGLGTNHAVYHK